jgi:hypothetical protein
MKLAKRFKALVETSPDDQPDYVWLAHAVCAVAPSGCGWSGWIIDAAYKRTAERYATGTGDKLMNADYSQKCPACAGVLFRTGFDRRLKATENQESPLKACVDYEAVENIDWE